MCLKWFLKAPSNQQNITVQNLTQNEQDFLPLFSIYNLVIGVNSSTGLSSSFSNTQNAIRINNVKFFNVHAHEYVNKHQQMVSVLLYHITFLV